MADQGQPNQGQANQGQQGQGQQPDLVVVLVALQQTQVDIATVVGCLVPMHQPIGFHLLPTQFNTNANIVPTSCACRSIYEETQKGLHDKYDLLPDSAVIKASTLWYLSLPLAQPTQSM